MSEHRFACLTSPLFCTAPRRVQNSDWSEFYQSYGVSVTVGVMDSIVDSVIREAAFYWAGLPWDDT